MKQTILGSTKEELHAFVDGRARSDPCAAVCQIGRRGLPALAARGRRVFKADKGSALIRSMERCVTCPVPPLNGCSGSRTRRLACVGRSFFQCLFFKTGLSPLSRQGLLLILTINLWFGLRAFYRHSTKTPFVAEALGRAAGIRYARNSSFAATSTVALKSATRFFTDNTLSMMLKGRRIF